LLLAEKRALFKFVSVFAAFNTLFLIILSLLYYSYQKNVYTEIRQNEIINYADTTLESIYYAETTDKLDDYVLHDQRFDVAVLDRQRHILYPQRGAFAVPPQKGFIEAQEHFFYITTIELDKIKGAHYLVIRARTIDGELAQTRDALALFLSFSILFFGVVIFILSRLFLRPLREYIELLDHFIRDATHELNTPISVLSMSLQRFEKNGLTAKNITAVERMTVAIRTLSHLYDDLTFMMFSPKEYPSAVLRIDELVSQRIAYFMPLIAAKGLTVTSVLAPCTLRANERAMERIVDNLLSNAVKYNKKNGWISVELTQESLTVADSGKGFDTGRTREIFERYKRLDSASGGFGLGLSIVKTLCDLYGIGIDVVSQKNVGSTFTLLWESSRIVHA